LTIFYIHPIKTKPDFKISANSPDLPGCVSTGATIKETLSRMKDAIQFHVEGMKKEGLDIPEPSTKVEYIEISIK